MKIQLASDLHLELIDPKRQRAPLIRPEPDADVLVLAGDIHAGSQAVEYFADWPVPVLYVAGNHEYYRQNWRETRRQLRQASAGTAVRFLDEDSYEIRGVRFLGCTFWTDYQLRGSTQAQAMAWAATHLNDHFVIQTDEGRFTPADALEDHHQSRAWLQRVLAQPFDGPTVVITHHAPHPLSVHPRFAYDPLSPAFVSDQTELLFKASFWLHGHTHDSFDYTVGNCRVVANPAGYLNGYREIDGAPVAVLENSAFRPDLLIDVK